VRYRVPPQTPTERLLKCEGLLGAGEKRPRDFLPDRVGTPRRALHRPCRPRAVRKSKARATPPECGAGLASRPPDGAADRRLEQDGLLPVPAPSPNRRTRRHIPVLSSVGSSPRVPRCNGRGQQTDSRARFATGPLAASVQAPRPNQYNVGLAMLAERVVRDLHEEALGDAFARKTATAVFARTGGSCQAELRGRGA
jgi:hypothetical protein